VKKRIQPLSLLLFVLDLCIVPVGLALATKLRTIVPLGDGGALPWYITRLPWQVYLFGLVCWPFSLSFVGAYDPERVLRWYNEVWRVVLGSILATTIMAGVLYFSFRETSRLQFIYFFLLNLIFMIAYRGFLRVYYRLVGSRRPGTRSKILITGAGELGERSARVVLDLSRWGYDLIGFLDDDPEKQGKIISSVPVVGQVDQLNSVVRRNKVEEVWIALPTRAHNRVRWIVNELEKLPVRIKIVPDYYSLALVTAKPEIMGGLPVIGLREPVIEGFERVVKRGFDLLITSLSLIFIGPVLLIIALAIKIDSPGPALFRQKRYGENGRIFEMLKFRTMVKDAEMRQDEVIQEIEGDELIHKKRDDPRITRLGHFLRRYSLDELPQLLNVIRGEMSLVGPRPELPWLVDRYDSWQRKRFAVPQGITGWWQINGRSDKPMHLNTEDDLFYVYNYTIWLDIRILIKTPLTVFRGVGAF